MVSARGETQKNICNSINSREPNNSLAVALVWINVSVLFWLVAVVGVYTDWRLLPFSPLDHSSFVLAVYSVFSQLLLL